MTKMSLPGYAGLTNAVAGLGSGVVSNSRALFGAPEPVRRSSGASLAVPGATSLLKYAALGAATGARTSAGGTALAWSSSSADPAWLRSPAARGVTTLMAGGEGVGDQLPGIGSRLVPQQLVPRLLAAAGSGALLARRVSEPLAVGATVAVAGALVGAYAGSWWRGFAARRLGRDNYGAVIEDALVAGAAGWAVR
jgi:uncharacterized membrane protein